jgi:hypothetical protein
MELLGSLVSSRIVAGEYPAGWERVCEQLRGLLVSERGVAPKDRPIRGPNQKLVPCRMRRHSNNDVHYRQQSCKYKACQMHCLSTIADGVENLTKMEL